MNLHRSIGLTMAALALTGLSAGRANGDLVVRNAHFRLPFTATWEQTVLPAGEYTLSVSRRSPVLYVVTFEGAGKKTTILAPRALGPEPGNRSLLVAECSGRSCGIRSLNLAHAGVVLLFSVGKPKEMLLAGSPETQSVPILVAER